MTLRNLTIHSKARFDMNFLPVIYILINNDLKKRISSLYNPVLFTAKINLLIRSIENIFPSFKLER